MSNPITLIVSLAAVVVIAALGILLTLARSDLKTLESDNKVLQNDNALQGKAIATQAFNFNRFNMIAETTSRNNSLIDASTEKTVIEYREILRREKTCNLLVPVDISDGLLDYTNRLRSSAMHTDTSGIIETDNSAVTPKRLTYCQTVPWVRLLLAEAEKVNNQLAGIREIESSRQSK